jgi:hypothetical protein
MDRHNYSTRYKSELDQQKKFREQYRSPEIHMGPKSRHYQAAQDKGIPQIFHPF